MRKHNTEIWEGWTIQNFIDELSVSLATIQSNNSWKAPLETKEELKTWCIDNQPYYKKYIPEVVEYFAELYKIK